jgi:glutamate-5-semialdehyde dehydrogenase
MSTTASGIPSTAVPDDGEHGMIVLAGDRLVRVPDDVVAAFGSGDRLIAIASIGEVLHVPREQHEEAARAVARARAAFTALASAPDGAITGFYDAFAARLADEATWAAIARANGDDVARARKRGRPTTRLAVSEKMRRAMIDGLAAWRDTPSRRGVVIATTEHDGWRLDHVVDGLGVVGFVFEGRPNVFADATGILRSGNTAVMRIGGDALGTARALDRLALRPALAESGLPEGAIVLVDSAHRAAGWALFSHPDLSLAVARGSGPAVAQLGAIARQAGTPVSLHGAGGAWIVADATANAERFHAAVYHSLDRKVCNTLNTLCIVRERAVDLVPVLLNALEKRGRATDADATQGGDRVPATPGYKLHVTPGACPYVPAPLFERTAIILRAEGAVEEPIAEELAAEELGREWEWERTPEVTVTVVADVGEAITLFNRQSPLFAASLISEDPVAHETFFRAINAPFVGDGFTRWVDGQYALNRPELGLANWRNGRLFARGAILSGDGVYTVRYRVQQRDPHVHR